MEDVRLLVVVSVLFSEPKIPQSKKNRLMQYHGFRFQCSSASRKFLNVRLRIYNKSAERFQCSSASRKFLNRIGGRQALTEGVVSVLFSEPKIPQSISSSPAPGSARSFSALQRAENSSIRTVVRSTIDGCGFQCSSASRKFLNIEAQLQVCWQRTFQCSSASRKFLNPTAKAHTRPFCRFQCSSASRKFLNVTLKGQYVVDEGFQCSSASRKFLNVAIRHHAADFVFRFSALQRAENSSIRRTRAGPGRPVLVSVLFSEPKIPQWLSVSRADGTA